MNDLVRNFRFEGQILFPRHGTFIARSIDPVAVRRFIGMVFQQPNPFAMSIFKNVAFGLRLNGYRGNLHDKVEQALAGGGSVGRGEGQITRKASCRFRADNGSGCASPALPSPPSRRSCSWTNRARPWTRSPR